MIFDYRQQKVFTESFQVDDIGNVCLRCAGYGGVEYYLVTKTIMGKTFVLKAGPVFPDIDALGCNYDLSVKKINYQENLISKEINALVNDPKKDINSVTIVSKEDVKKELLTLHEIFEDTD